MLKYNTIKRYVFLMAVCAFYSCQQQHRMGMDHLNNLLDPSKVRYTYKKKNSEYQPLISSCTIPIVILVNSKNEKVSETNEMKEKLNKEFGDRIQIIQAEYKRRHWLKRKCIGNVYKIPNAIYKLIASSLSEQYGKNSKSIYKTIDVHIFGFDEKTKLLGHKIMERSDGFSKGPSWMHPEEWQFPLNIKTIACIKAIQKKDKKGPKKDPEDVKFFEDITKSKFTVIKKEHFIQTYIKFLRGKLAKIEYEF